MTPSKHTRLERVKLLLGVGRVVAYVVMVLASRYVVVVCELVVMVLLLLMQVMLLLLFVVVRVAADDHSWVRVGVWVLGEMAMMVCVEHDVRGCGSPVVVVGAAVVKDVGVGCCGDDDGVGRRDFHLVRVGVLV